jgi:dTDP-4-amino-4,6-dideoxygalactose transaminase
MTSPAKIPFVDLVRIHEELETELIDVVKKAFATAGFVGGAMVDEFEADFAQFCDTKHCVGVNSGTDALRFALVAAGVATGDIAVTVPHTFIATTEAISQAGAHVAFVDIDEATYTMDPEALRNYLENMCEFDSVRGKLIEKRSKRTVAAVVPVHIYGHMADMDPILELARRFNLLVIEDACQAHGAEYFSEKENCWRKAGSMGIASAFSFYPGKNLGACGEAGAVTTNDQRLAQKIRMLRDHGQASKYYHEMEGYNGRIDSIQAGILSVKLKHLRSWNEERREHAQRYDELFAAEHVNLVTPYEAPWSKAVYHLYVIQVEDRAGSLAAFAKEDIGCGIHYPIPLHLQNAYAHLGHSVGDFPIAERAALRILSLPMFPGISEAAQSRIVQSLVRTLESTPVSRAATASA